MIDVRASEPTDAAKLLRIWCDSVDATHHFLSAEDRASIEPLVADYVREAPLWVALKNGEPVGFMGVTGQNIDSLFLAPDAHGLGIGRLLTERVPRPTTVEVNEQNEAAVAFYQRMGFEETGRSPTDGDGRPYPLLHMRRD
jgi:putative acetyltransferase